MNFARFRSLFLSLPHTEERPHFDEVAFYFKNSISTIYQLNRGYVSFALSHEATDMLSMLSIGIDELECYDGWLRIPQTPAHDALTIEAIRYIYMDEVYMSKPGAAHTAMHQVVLDAPLDEVWDLLTLPVHLAGWDDLAPNVDIRSGRVRRGQEFIWKLPSGEESIMTLDRIDPYRSLRYNLYVTQWPMMRELYDVNYEYELISNGVSTLLTMKFGDFGLLPDAEQYRTSTEAYARAVGQKLKNYLKSYSNTTRTNKSIRAVFPH